MHKLGFVGLRPIKL